MTDVSNAERLIDSAKKLRDEMAARSEAAKEISAAADQIHSIMLLFYQHDWMYDQSYQKLDGILGDLMDIEEGIVKWK